jgi:hypothetical protein
MFVSSYWLVIKYTKCNAKIGYGHLCMREENDEVDQIKSNQFYLKSKYL